MIEGKADWICTDGGRWINVGAGPCGKSFLTDSIFWVKVESKGGVRGLYLSREWIASGIAVWLPCSIKNPFGV